MTTEQYSMDYDEGYQDGWDAAVEPSQQEPWSNVVIGVDVTKEGVSVTGIYKVSNDSSHLFYSQFYATQAQRQPLTDDEIDAVERALEPLFLDVPMDFMRDFARAIEAAHGITGKKK